MWITKVVELDKTIVTFYLRSMAVGILGMGALINRCTGKLGNSYLYYDERGCLIIRSAYKKVGRNSVQKSWDVHYNRVDNLWSELSTFEKDAWRKIAKGKAISNYAIFMRTNLNREKAGETLWRVPHIRGE